MAPDKFKGTLDASAVAEAIADGVGRARPGAEIEIIPLADGGEGTREALLSALGGRRFSASVTGPLGDPIEAPYAILGDGRAVVEVAAATGLTLMDEASRDPLRATSRGTGELLAAAASELAASGAEHPEIIVGIGGSASTDGGTGAASAAGWRFLDARGNELAAGGGALRDLRRIERKSVDRWVGTCSIMGACDIDNPLFGPTGAARVFGPQKGASPDEVELLDEGLMTLASRFEEDLDCDVAGLPGAGASGGIGAGLIAFFDATLRPGFDLVAEVTGLEAALAAADVVITGEGSLDASSLGGKTPVGVARLARKAGTECIAVAGRLELGENDLASESITKAVGLEDVVGRERAAEAPGAVIAEAVQRLLEMPRGG